jgi:hypothetical protein
MAKKDEIRFGVGGIPTDIDVRALQEAFGTPEPGDIILYPDISDCIKTEQATNRWKSVVGAWRRKLEIENNLLLTAIDSVGYRVMDNHERASYVAKSWKNALRQGFRAAARAARTPRKGLASEECRSLDHVANRGATVRLQENVAAKALRYDPDAVLTGQKTGQKTDPDAVLTGQSG